jgi:hypothetical protein
MLFRGFRAAKILSQWFEAERSRGAQGPGERPAPPREFQAGRAGMQVGTPARQPGPRVGPDDVPSRYKAKQAGLDRTLLAAYTGTHRGHTRDMLLGSHGHYSISLPCPQVSHVGGNPWLQGLPGLMRQGIRTGRTPLRDGDRGYPDFRGCHPAPSAARERSEIRGSQASGMLVYCAASPGGSPSNLPGMPGTFARHGQHAGPAWRCPGSCDVNPNIVPAESQPAGFPRRLGASPVTAVTAPLIVDRYLRFPGVCCFRG